MSILTDTYELNNSTFIPKIGFGTWQIPNGEAAYNATALALKNGYRHIDTAKVYGNEESVGQAIKDSGIAREEIYLTTKLPAEIKTYEGALEAFESSIEKLGTDYVDLYIIHAPWPWDDMGSEHAEGNVQAWKALEEIYKSGRAKAIGVSNFNSVELQNILDNGTVVPAVNQIRLHIGFPQFETTEFCEQHGILVEAYSPLATGRILDNDAVQTIAQKYGKTVAQVSIRYTIQRGTVSLPKSTHEEYIIQNADVAFEIDDEDMAFLNAIETNEQ